MITIKVIDGIGNVLDEKTGEEVTFVYKKEYQPNDVIVVEATQANCYLMLQLDDTMGEHLVYLTDHKMEFPIPFEEKRICYSPKSFAGEIHLIKARVASEHEVKGYQNLALNPYDCHEAIHCFPHATANVETRGESVFAAKNAINGNHANECHGAWPYESWGINRNPDATLKIDFGRKVTIDQLVFYLRADFPHDSYWTEATIQFSDESTMTVSLEKTALAQSFKFSPKEVSYIQLQNLIKVADDSPFPALSQIEAYGWNQ